MLVVGVNSDEWLKRKKGRYFMPISERLAIVKSLIYVDIAMEFNDDDNSAYDLIKKVKDMFPSGELLFLNGGDRTDKNIPEMELADKDNLKVKFVFGVGGTDKMNSSSWILEEWKAPKTERDWGWYRVIEETSKWKVKELTILPGKSLSDQRHKHRDEHWHVVEGQVMLNLQDDSQSYTKKIEEQQSFDIKKNTWHRAYNITDKPSRVIEIWFGDILTEFDIERRQ